MAMWKKRLTPEIREAVGGTIKMLLHESRDNLRTDWGHKYDTAKVPFYVGDPYYAEAFGMLRTLVALNYAKDTFALFEWFSSLKEEVLAEEHFGGSGRCEHCLSKHGKDDKSMQEARVRDFEATREAVLGR